MTRLRKPVEVPKGLTLEERRPRCGESGWYVYVGETMEEWLADIVDGRDTDETPGGFGWLAVGDEPIEGPTVNGRESVLVTVIWRPLRHVVTITLEMEGARADIDRAVRSALDSGAIQAQLLELEDDLELGPYAIHDASYAVRS